MMNRKKIKVLGIDPGTGRTGWAILEKEAGKEKLIDCGCLETTVKSPLPERLEMIYEFVKDLIKKYKPNEAAVEELFFATNAKTAMSVSQARGVVLLACKLSKIPSFDYTPLNIKSAITGYGKADKKMVEKMVMLILNLKEKQKLDDTADAMAVALTHLASRKR